MNYNNSPGNAQINNTPGYSCTMNENEWNDTAREGEREKENKRCVA